MKPLNIVILVILILIVLFALIIILYNCYKEKLNNLIYKLDTSIENFNKNLIERYEIVIKLIELVISKYNINIKLFDEVKELDDTNPSNLNNTIIEKCYNEIIQIKEDNQKNRELKAFRELIDKYEDVETYIVSFRTYYNKYVLEYNNKIKKFPYNIISKFKNIKLKNILEGKELDINLNNDLEV